jgi:hypothetical protein
MLRAPLTLGAPMLKLPPYLAIAVPVWLVPLTILIIVPRLAFARRLTTKPAQRNSL